MHDTITSLRANWWPARLWAVILAGALTATARGDVIVVTTTNSSGPGSFIQALTTANTNPAVDTITFNIPGTPPFTISPTVALSSIVHPLLIDGRTQPGFNPNNNQPVIELTGGNSNGTAGLRFESGSGGSTLRGLAINRFPLSAVVLDSASNNLVGNFIGTDVTGLVARGAGSAGNPSYPGILVTSAGNVIGGTNNGDGNLISGGSADGLYFLAASNNLVLGNLIGVSAAGSNALGNANNGIVLYNSGGNVIGGPVPAARNIISGNAASGIYLSGGAAAGNVMQGNFIGTGISGSNAVSNAAGDGITVISAPGNLICSNLISGNGLAGVSIQSAGANGNQLFGNFIGTDVNGKIALTNHNSGVSISGAGGNQIGGTNAGAGNVISGNAFHGLGLTGGTTGNVVLGNFIGLTAAGAAALRNGLDGIWISGGTSNTIGGVTAGARNIISGNASNGVDIVLLTDSGNTVSGNYIGTDVTCTQPIANKLAGVRIQGCSNLIGGAVTGAGNVISGNTYQGIWIVGNNGTIAKGNVIQGNFIGVTAAGTVGMGNGLTTSASAGIGLSTAAANLIGGTAAGAGNVISANNGAGIFLVGTTTSSNVVQGNFIGTDPSGTIGVGNIWEGIYLEQAATNQIGGTASGAGNLISGNYTDGIFLTNASWNVIQGNRVGTKADGASNLANQYHNVELQLNANNNIVGGAAAGAGNTLAYASMNASKLYCGVRVRTGAFDNLISGNSIFSNGALGIDLSPVNDSSFANAPGVNPIVGCESGVVLAYSANDGQNYPTLSNVYSGAITRVRGSFNSQPSKKYPLQFFASPAGDSSGYGEGQVYLGQTNLSLSSSCSANFTAYLPAAVPPGWVVTATATDPNNNTSEFSAWVPVIVIPPIQLAQPGSSQLALSWTNNGGSFALQQTFSLTPPVTWLAVTNVPVLQNNFLVTTLRLTNSSVFYRLIAP